MFATKAAWISEAMQTDPFPYLRSHPQLLPSLLLMLSGCKFPGKQLTEASLIDQLSVAFTGLTVTEQA